MLTGFKNFLMRGNVVDLAVGVIIGAAFGAVVSELTKDVLTPLIGAIVGAPDFSKLAFTVNGSTFAIGNFMNAVVSFVLVAAAIYFFVIMPMNAVNARLARNAPKAAATTKKCKECCSDIPLEARRCAHCTQPV